MKNYELGIQNGERIEIATTEYRACGTTSTKGTRGAEGVPFDKTQGSENTIGYISDDIAMKHRDSPEFWYLLKPILSFLVSLVPLVAKNLHYWFYPRYLRLSLPDLPDLSFLFCAFCAYCLSAIALATAGGQLFFFSLP